MVKSRKSWFVRGGCGLMAFCLVWTQAALGNAAGPLASGASVGSVAPAAGLDGLVQWHVPESLGSVLERWQGNAGKVVFHIQDTHANYEAQMHTAQILEMLLKSRFKDRIRLVGVEGAAGRIQLEEFKKYPDKEILKGIADYFLKQALITGTEFFGIFHEDALLIHGIEDLDLYTGNLEKFLASHASGKEVEPLLKGLKDAYAKVSRAVYGGGAAAFMQLLESHRSGATGFSAYCEELARYARQYGVDLAPFEAFGKLIEAIGVGKSVDRKRMEKERADLIGAMERKVVKEDLAALIGKSLLYRTGQIPSGEFYDYLQGLATKAGMDMAAYKNLTGYIRALRLQNEVKTNDLFAECERLEGELQARCLQTPEERDFAAAQKRLAILENLVGLKMNRAELAVYRRHQDATSAVELGKFLEGVLAKAATQTNDAWRVPLAPGGGEGSGGHAIVPKRALAGLGRLDAALGDMRGFYEKALMRDHAIVRNTLRLMDQNKLDVAVLVTGGFHTEGAMELLKQQGISYVVVNPRLTKTDHEELYLSRMLNEELPLEHFFSRRGNRLAVASPFSEVDIDREFPGGIHVKTVEERRQILQTLSTLYQTARVRALLAGKDADNDVDEAMLNDALRREFSDDDSPMPVPKAVKIARAEGREEIQILFKVLEADAAGRSIPSEFVVRVEKQVAGVLAGMHQDRLANLDGDLYDLLEKQLSLFKDESPATPQLAVVPAQAGVFHEAIGVEGRASELLMWLNNGHESENNIANKLDAIVADACAQKKISAEDLAVLLGDAHGDQKTDAVREGLINSLEAMASGATQEQMGYLSTGTGPLVAGSSTGRVFRGPSSGMTRIQEALLLAKLRQEKGGDKNPVVDKFLLNRLRARAQMAREELLQQQRQGGESSTPDALGIVSLRLLESLSRSESQGQNQIRRHFLLADLLNRWRDADFDENRYYNCEWAMINEFKKDAALQPADLMRLYLDSHPLATARGRHFYFSSLLLRYPGMSNDSLRQTMLALFEDNAEASRILRNDGAWDVDANGALTLKQLLAGDGAAEPIMPELKNTLLEARLLNDEQLPQELKDPRNPPVVVNLDAYLDLSAEQMQAIEKGVPIILLGKESEYWRKMAELISKKYGALVTHVFAFYPQDPVKIQNVYKRDRAAALLQMAKEGKALPEADIEELLGYETVLRGMGLRDAEFRSHILNVAIASFRGAVMRLERSREGMLPELRDVELAHAMFEKILAMDPTLEALDFMLPERLAKFANTKSLQETTGKQAAFFRHEIVNKIGGISMCLSLAKKHQLSNATIDEMIRVAKDVAHVGGAYSAVTRLEVASGHANDAGRESAAMVRFWLSDLYWQFISDGILRLREGRDAVVTALDSSEDIYVRKQGRNFRAGFSSLAGSRRKYNKRTYGMNEPPHFELVDIRKEIEAILLLGQARLIQPLRTRVDEVKVVIQDLSDTPDNSIMMDVEMLLPVLENLIKNAYEAMLTNALEFDADVSEMATKIMAGERYDDAALLKAVVSRMKQDDDSTARVKEYLEERRIALTSDVARMGKDAWIAQTSLGLAKIVDGQPVMTISIARDSDGGLLIQVKDTGKGIRAEQLLASFAGKLDKAEKDGGIRADSPLGQAVAKIMAEVNARGYWSNKGEKLPELPAELKRKIYDLLFFPSATFGKVQGTGVGLDVVRDTMKELGGDVFIAATEVGKGTTLALVFPAAQPATAVVPPEAPVAKPGAPVAPLQMAMQSGEGQGDAADAENAENLLVDGQIAFAAAQGKGPGEAPPAASSPAALPASGSAAVPSTVSTQEGSEMLLVSPAMYGDGVKRGPGGGLPPAAAATDLAPSDIPASIQEELAGDADMPIGDRMPVDVLVQAKALEALKGRGAGGTPSPANAAPGTEYAPPSTEVSRASRNPARPSMPKPDSPVPASPVREETPVTGTPSAAFDGAADDADVRLQGQGPGQGMPGEKEERSGIKRELLRLLDAEDVASPGLFNAIYREGAAEPSKKKEVIRELIELYPEAMMRVIVARGGLDALRDGAVKKWVEDSYGDRAGGNRDFIERLIAGQEKAAKLLHLEHFVKDIRRNADGALDENGIELMDLESGSLYPNLWKEPDIFIACYKFGLKPEEFEMVRKKIEERFGARTEPLKEGHVILDDAGTPAAKRQFANVARDTVMRVANVGQSNIFVFPTAEAYRDIWMEEIGNVLIALMAEDAKSLRLTGRQIDALGLTGLTEFGKFKVGEEYEIGLFAEMRGSMEERALQQAATARSA